MRDRATGSGGSVGKNGSGLGERLYAIQDPSSSVTAILAVQAGGGNGVVVERYIYQPAGSVTVLNTNGSVRGIGSSNSAYNWFYLYEGSRDSGGGFYYLNGVEWNSLTGLPVKEDPTAYSAAVHAYNDGSRKRDRFDFLEDTVML